MNKETNNNSSCCCSSVSASRNSFSLLSMPGSWTLRVAIRPDTVCTYITTWQRAFIEGCWSSWYDSCLGALNPARLWNLEFACKRFRGSNPGRTQYFFTFLSPSYSRREKRFIVFFALWPLHIIRAVIGWREEPITMKVAIVLVYWGE